MNNFIKKFYSQDLYKILSINGLNIFVRFLVGFISNKATAYFIGVSGMGIVGLVKNFIAFLDSVLLLGTKNGIVSNLASNNKIDNKQRFVVSLFWFFTAFSILFSILFSIFSKSINEYFFANQITDNFVFILFSICIPFQALSLFFIAILNGESSYKQVTLVGIISSIVTLAITVLLMYKFSVTGAIFAMLISFVIAFFISGFYFVKKYPISIFFKPFQFAVKQSKFLFNYSLMSLVSAVLSVMLSYYIRITIIEKFSLNHAGYYESILRLSSFYMIFISTFITFYFLPELAKCTSKIEINKLTNQYYKSIIPLFFIGLLIILIGMKFIVPFFFNNDFLPIIPYLKYQLLLDFIKGIYMILGIRFFAFGNSRGFLITEIFSFVMQFLLFVLALKFFDFEGVWLSQIASSIMYFVFLIIYFKNDSSLLKSTKK